MFRFDHTALAVRDLDAGMRLFRDCLGGRLVKYSCDPDRAGCTLRFANGVCVELMEPLIPGTFLQRFVDTRGEGVHHLTFLVGDLRRAIAGLRAAGYALSGEDFTEPEWSEVFISPRSAHGTVVQLVQTTRTPEQLESGHSAARIEDARRRHVLARRTGRG